jgi:hypothetical protein
MAILPQTFAVCHLDADAPVPLWAQAGDFWSLTRTADELSILCPQGLVPEGTLVETNWRAFKVEGPLDFALVGILADLSGALARAGISLFALSTFDTDYLLIRAEKLEEATAALRAAGHAVRGE